ncbi:hypothetical protein [Aquimarina rubra]|uniref:PepSY domain-containing protein n=1 Tax=Aquimarina rubra TaxID=1920033 RepID=A0ABW5LBB0_9FLAO
MFYSNSIIWIFCFSICFSISGYSQNKLEREFRIKSSDVPTLALDFMNQGPFDKKIKWYAEESQNGKSIEAKTCYKNIKYSIEFDTNGKPQDVEQKVSFASIPESLRKQIKSSLDSVFVKSKIKKIQKQWVGSRSALISLINQKTTPQSYDLNYEFIVRGKKDKQYTNYELLYNKKGVLLQILKIVSANTDNLIY